MQRVVSFICGIVLVPAMGLAGDIVVDGKLKSTRSKEEGPPLEVESDAVVANLNADRVDGVEGTDLYTKAQVDALLAAVAGSDSRRWFYLATDKYTGADPLDACDLGFHMASMWEILDVSNLRYDTIRGQKRADSGMGPPLERRGWIRTGNYGYYVGVGQANCAQVPEGNPWVTDDPGLFGTAIWLEALFWNDQATMIAPWTAGDLSCASELGVWCIED